MSRTQQIDNILEGYTKDWMSVVFDNLKMDANTMIFDPEDIKVEMWVGLLHVKKFIPKYNKHKDKNLSIIMTHIFSTIMTAIPIMIEEHGIVEVIRLYDTDRRQFTHAIRDEALSILLEELNDNR